MNSPSFNGVNRLNCFKVEDQQKQHNLSGSLARLQRIPPPLNLNNPDMSSVSYLEGTDRPTLQHMNQKPTVLLNSPTFNTLDNRFDNHADNNHFKIGGGGEQSGQSPHSPSNNNVSNPQFFAESHWMSNQPLPIVEAE